MCKGNPNEVTSSHLVWLTVETPSVAEQEQGGGTPPAPSSPPESPVPHTLRASPGQMCTICRVCKPSPPTPPPSLHYPQPLPSPLTTLPSTPPLPPSLHYPQPLTSSLTTLSSNPPLLPHYTTLNPSPPPSLHYPQSLPSPLTTLPSIPPLPPSLHYPQPLPSPPHYTTLTALDSLVVRSTANPCRVPPEGVTLVSTALMVPSSTLVLHRTLPSRGSCVH